MYKSDYMVYIGRFQPFHAGHYQTAISALKHCKTLIFIIGGAEQPRTCKDPFTVDKRIKIIKSCFTEEEIKRLRFVPQINYLYNDAKWVASIQGSVRTVIANDPWTPDPISTGLTGYNKDGSSYYLSFFPEWGWLSAPESHYHATDVRNAFYEQGASAFKSEWFINNHHLDVVRGQFLSLPLEVDEEHIFLKQYKSQFKDLKYPPFFVTGDAVVTQGGYILLVERDASPGRGQLALPGGFIKADEFIETGIIRELYEETKLKVPKPVLKGSIVKRQVYDNPFRSQRGRTITHAVHIKLADGYNLPDVKGSDDAKKAFWLDLSCIQRKEMFEDHYDIIDDMLGGLPRLLDSDRPRL